MKNIFIGVLIFGILALGLTLSPKIEFLKYDGTDSCFTRYINYYNDTLQIGIIDGVNTWDGDLTVDTLKQYYNYVTKIHRTAVYNTTTTNWDTLKWDTLIAGETVGTWSLGTDSTTITPPDTGLYFFAGCVHIKNNGGVNVDAYFASYLVAGIDTAICSQQLQQVNKDAGQSATITYTGSIRLGTSSELQVLFIVENTDLDLELTDVLPKSASASIHLQKISD